MACWEASRFCKGQAINFRSKGAFRLPAGLSGSEGWGQHNVPSSVIGGQLVQLGKGGIKCLFPFINIYKYEMWLSLYSRHDN